MPKRGLDRGWEAVVAYFDARSDGAPLRAIGDEPVFARHDKLAGKRILPITTRTV